MENIEKTINEGKLKSDVFRKAIAFERTFKTRLKWAYANRGERGRLIPTTKMEQDMNFRWAKTRIDFFSQFDFIPKELIEYMKKVVEKEKTPQINRRNLYELQG